MEYKMEYRLTDLCELIMGQSPDSSSCNKDGKGIPFYQGNADFGNFIVAVEVEKPQQQRVKCLTDYAKRIARDIAHKVFARPL